METEQVTCPECGVEFEIDIPKGKRVTISGKRRFQKFSPRQVTFKCPNCRINMWANFE